MEINPRQLGKITLVIEYQLSNSEAIAIAEHYRIRPKEHSRERKELRIPINKFNEYFKQVALEGIESSLQNIDAQLAEANDEYLEISFEDSEEYTVYVE